MTENTARLSTAGKLLLFVVAVALPVRRAESQMVDSLRLSCEDGNATACSNLGNMYYGGEGGELRRRMGN